jgi:hypothetical protein
MSAATPIGAYERRLWPFRYMQSIMSLRPFVSSAAYGLAIPPRLHEHPERHGPCSVDLVSRPQRLKGH